MPPQTSYTHSSPTVPSLAIGGVQPRFAFVHACWHMPIVEQGRDGCLAEFLKLGVPTEAVEVFKVPGAFELPLMARKLARSGRYDAVVACALVVDGGIYRHDFVAAAVVNALMTAQLETEVPILSVVLTPHQFQPSVEHRTFFSAHFVEKGAEAARACVETVQALRRVAEPPSQGGQNLLDDDAGTAPMQ